MKEHVTMQEAALLIGRTTKTIKNYIKRGLIRTFHHVEGKYGQEYRIAVVDLEPFGLVRTDLLDEALPKRRKRSRDRLGSEAAGNVSEAALLPLQLDTMTFVRRYEELVSERGRTQEKIDALADENKKLRQEIEEKNMLISILMKKSENSFAS